MKAKDNKEIVSAYDVEGKKRTKKKQKDMTLSKGFKVLTICLYVLGFFGALAIIILVSTKCS